MMWDRTEKLVIDGKEFIAEFGSSSPVNFARATPCDEEGNALEVKCKCGEKSISIIMGKDSFQWLCSKCMGIA